MEIDFAILPQYAIDRICTFLDNKSILQMREVSKSTKEIVDIFIVRHRKIEISTFEVETKEKGTKFDVWFYFQNDWDHCVWKSCFQHVMKRLKISNFKLERNATGGVRVLKLITVKLNKENVESVFKQLKPFIRQTIFGKISIMYCPRKIATMCADFFGGSTVDTVSIMSLRFGSHYELFFNLIQCTKPRLVLFFIKYKISWDVIGWLLNLHDSVHSLYVNVMKSLPMELNTISIVRGFLNGGCKNIDLSFGSDVVVTLADAEDLLQVLHNADTKCRIFAWTNGEHLNVTKGICSIRTVDRGRDPARRHITIKHI